MRKVSTLPLPLSLYLSPSLYFKEQLLPSTSHFIPKLIHRLRTHTISGLFVYTILNALVGLVVFLSNNRIEPREYDLKEYWTWKGSGRPPWFVRAMRRDRRSRVSPSSRDDHHNAVPPIAEQNESQRDLNLQQSRDNPPSGKDGSAAMAEQSVLPIDHDEAYDYHHHSSPMRGIAR